MHEPASYLTFGVRAARAMRPAFVVGNPPPALRVGYYVPRLSTIVIFLTVVALYLAGQLAKFAILAAILAAIFAVQLAVYVVVAVANVVGYLFSLLP